MSKVNDTELDEILLQHREYIRGIRTDRLIGTSDKQTKQSILTYINDHYTANEDVENIIGEDLGEEDGWDYFFNEKDKCCPGDDFAEFGNAIKAEQRQRLNELKGKK